MYAELYPALSETVGQRFERATRTSLLRRIDARLLRLEIDALPERARLQIRRARTGLRAAAAVLSGGRSNS